MLNQKGQSLPGVLLSVSLLVLGYAAVDQINSINSLSIGELQETNNEVLFKANARARLGGANPLFQSPYPEITATSNQVFQISSEALNDAGVTTKFDKGEVLSIEFQPSSFEAGENYTDSRPVVTGGTFTIDSSDYMTLLGQARANIGKVNSDGTETKTGQFNLPLTLMAQVLPNGNLQLRDGSFAESYAFNHMAKNGDIDKGSERDVANLAYDAYSGTKQQNDSEIASLDLTTNETKGLVDALGEALSLANSGSPIPSDGAALAPVVAALEEAGTLPATNNPRETAGDTDTDDGGLADAGGGGNTGCSNGTPDPNSPGDCLVLDTGPGDTMLGLGGGP